MGLAEKMWKLKLSNIQQYKSTVSVKHNVGKERVSEMNQCDFGQSIYDAPYCLLPYSAPLAVSYERFSTLSMHEEFDDLFAHICNKSAVAKHFVKRIPTTASDQVDGENGLAEQWQERVEREHASYCVSSTEQYLELYGTCKCCQ